MAIRQTSSSSGTVPLSQILLDPLNPRLPEVPESQAETIAALARAQGKQLVAMADHIIQHGMNPTDLPLVLAAADEPCSYYVLDGNRRILALKALETPELVEHVLEPSEYKRLQKLSAWYAEAPIEEIRCVIASTREAADPWIQLRHRYGDEGAGPVSWTAQMGARYDERQGKQSLALQVLDFLSREQAPLSTSTRESIRDGKYPVTTLDRLLRTPAVRGKLGLEMSDSVLRTSYPSEGLVPALTRVVDDIGTGSVTVTGLKLLRQRTDYIDRLGEKVLPDANTRGTLSRPLGQEGTPEADPGGKRQRKKRVPCPRPRTALIPSSCVLSIGHHRIEAIYLELKKISADTCPNATAILFRVFLELSLDHFLEKDAGWSEREMDRARLQAKMTRAADYLENNGLMTKPELVSLRNAAVAGHLLSANFRTLHNAVHNRHFSPIASDLRTLWNDLQLFFERIWS
ncbi:MAG: hypothetical protein HUU35_01705 [Armatimonadetes bacterium]|nr:hypothetical protein [Armatimonadota bacterium]